MSEPWIDLAMKAYAVFAAAACVFWAVYQVCQLEIKSKCSQLESQRLERQHVENVQALMVRQAEAFLELEKARRSG